MAGLQHRNGSYRVLFRYHGKQHAFTLGEVSQDEAETKAAQVDYLLMRLQQRLASIPAGMTILDYVQFDGRPEETPVAEKVTLGTLRDRYIATHESSLEATTVKGIRSHFKHLVTALGEQFPIAELSLADLQGYVDRRLKAAGRKGRKLSPATIQKEIISLRTAWNWGSKMKLVVGRFPNHGLRYPKTVEKPPFMTREEIERRIAAGNLTKVQISDLYDSMYLTVTELDEMLQHVKISASRPFLYPMVCFAAHTGARRSEIIRTQLTDVDFKGRVVTIHEKKRVRGKATTRRVPMSPFLIGALEDWLKVHPGGPYLFVQQAIVERSRTRSPTTGHKGQKTRSKSPTERAANVKVRQSHPAGPITPTEAHDHLRRTLAESKWSVLKGWHVCRHSFVSACASKGVDQRLVESWAGHMSAEMSRRYSHLYPSTQQAAIATVFG
ncbi:MAG: site-specific recombinase XerD [Schlesneria sp.]|nr:site-specific recombinase XerD [Schlesneria sp.]